MATLAQRLKQQARALGFELAGIAPAVSAPGAESLRAWIEKGRAGEMRYMERHAAAREHPRGVLPEVRSVLMVALNYQTRRPDGSSGGTGISACAGRAQAEMPVPPSLSSSNQDLARGRIASYAWGGDYHDVLWDRLNRLLAWVREEVPGCKGRAVVDTAPLLERDFARLAGLGWFGKNTMLLNKHLGSFFFLGALLLDVELPADEPFAANHCGTCTACLDACPTQAFPAPYELDARRCISYLTIELRKPIPAELRPGMGEWIFGCDICQDVCPWNRKAPLSKEPAFQPHDDLEAPDLIELLHLTPEQFRERFRDTALRRPKRGGFLRNVAIALGNAGDARAVPALIEALNDSDALVRGAAAWALGRIGGQAAHAALEARLDFETDAEAQGEIRAALADVTRS